MNNVGRGGGGGRVYLIRGAYFPSSPRGRGGGGGGGTPICFLYRDILPVKVSFSGSSVSGYTISHVCTHVSY